MPENCQWENGGFYFIFPPFSALLEREDTMVDFEKAKNEIRETYKQIGLTDSKQRKKQLHRHLAKQWKEYNEAKMYVKRATANG